MSNKTDGLREFGKFRLDAKRKVLWFEEKPVNLPLKEIEMLCVLTESGGEVVTKDEILQKVWADSFVEESNLSRRIYVLRKTFKDYGAGRDLIETVPGRGYRFAGRVRRIENGDGSGGEVVIEKHTRTQTLIEIQEEEVEEQEQPGKEESARKELPQRAFSFRYASLPFFPVFAILLAAIGAAAFFGLQNRSAKSSAPEIKSIAVLPFEAIDAGRENEHEGLGLADILITRLSNLKEISVRPTSAVSGFKNGEQDLIAFGKKLRADAVLEGSIYRSGDKVRVTARLIKVADGAPVWTGEFEKLAADELRLQDEIAAQVVHALALNLSGGEKNALARRYTESADAYRLYVKGRYEWNKRSHQGMIEAERLFRNAIEKDPNFALAYSGLADRLATNGKNDHALLAVQKALELDPNLAEAHATLGFIKLFHEWQWREAENAFKKSIELNPNYATAYHWRAQALTVQGKHEEAKREMRRALEINPLSPNFLADLGQIYYFNGEYKAAEEYCHRALEIYPGFLFRSPVSLFHSFKNRQL
jgi:DNA-binding winged helix-turn-helix (wHTH) protein/TolB-like protein